MGTKWLTCDGSELDALIDELKTESENAEAIEAVAIVEGAGYPQPDRTHFRSLGIWHAGDRGGLRCEEGWIGRLSEALGAHGRACGEVLHVGGCAPFSMRSASCVPLTLGRNELDRGNLRPMEIARIEARLGGHARATEVHARPASSRQRAIDWRVAVDAALRAHLDKLRP